MNNNKLIADFMGFKFQNNPNDRWQGCYLNVAVGDVYYGVIEPELFQYSHSYNWIMSVVEKIESLNNSIQTVISMNMNKEYMFKIISYNYYNSSEKYYSTRIESLYNECINFIKWYNNGKQV